jgi:hypothetical protein
MNMKRGVAARDQKMRVYLYTFAKPSVLLSPPLRRLLFPLESTSVEISVKSIL